jgi:hypothetical protein
MCLFFIKQNYWIAFTEARNWIGGWSDNSNGNSKVLMEALYTNITFGGKHTYVMPDIMLRGGFRYVSVFLVTNITTRITDISLEIGFQPTWSNL